MIEASVNESFPIAVTLMDEEMARLVAGQVVTYDVRTLNDLELSPPISGTLHESSVENGIYKAEINLTDIGSYICYATCSGFFTSSEEILINNSFIDIVSCSFPHNISVTDVVRSSVDIERTTSQINRQVPFGKTDYILTAIKRDTDVDWSNPVSSGVSYAHYSSIDALLPYRMGASD